MPAAEKRKRPLPAQEMMEERFAPKRRKSSDRSAELEVRRAASA